MCNSWKSPNKIENERNLWHTRKYCAKRGDLINKQAKLFTYGYILSAIVGLLLSGFYYFQAVIIEVLWPEVTSRYLINAVIIVLVAGLLIWSNRKFGQLPQNIGVIKSDLKHTNNVNYRFVWLQLLIPALILTSGTSLGPEATLVSSTVLFGVWIRDKMHYYEVNYTAIRSKTWWLQFKELYFTRNNLVQGKSSNKDEVIDSTFSLRVKKVLKYFYFANGIAWFALFYKLSGQPSLIIRIGESHWQPKAWFIMIPLLIMSFGFGKFLNFLMKKLKQIILFRFTNQTWLIVFGGIMIYLASILGPEMLFSGQHNFHLFSTGWQNSPLWYLAFISLGKFALLSICKVTGWLGGDIFPVLFASTIIGFIVASWLPMLDQIFVVVMVAMGISTAILKSSILVGSLMGIMFAPVYLLPLVIAATALLYIYHHYNKIDLKPIFIKISAKFKTIKRSFLDKNVTE